jgi:GntR family transcriptional regulator/MocR family aminotransferase
MLESPAPITLDSADTAPAYRQIADRLREAIGAGLISAGDRLPSTRSLASQLGLARGTVDTAYAILAGEGYLQGRGPAGTVVSPSVTTHVMQAAASPAALTPPVPGPQPGILPFRLGLPALDAFPRTLWSRLTARAARQLGAAELAYPDPAGSLELREAIAAYLRVARGIVCSARQVLITGGFQGALGLITRTLLQPGDAAWTEDPGYFLAHAALQQAGADLVPVGIDAEGLRIADGVAAAPNARIAVVTPTHQSPLGVALSLPRRLALLAWAANPKAWIVEDDYDSEFRYTGRPLPALKSLDRLERVLYVGSFSKVLFPGLRLGYLVAPEPLAEKLTAASRTLQAGLPVLEQRVTAAFMAEGHFARHVRHMRSLYGARRKALAEALQTAFGPRMSLQLQAGGMHLLARLHAAPPDTELVRRATEAGLAPSALSSLSPSGRAGEGLLLGFTNTPEAHARDAADRLARALGL